MTSSLTSCQKLKPLPSRRQLAKMSLTERHQYLAPYIPKIAEDFLNDPELTEFCVLDAEDWEINLNEKIADS